ncbi:hypothetical protein [Tuberibacillus sp. Marseille-P3662]|nr:hypothetical protein [Tuberibacillus sp. Marseille-P3662]
MRYSDYYNHILIDGKPLTVRHLSFRVTLSTTIMGLLMPKYIG